MPFRLPPLRHLVRHAAPRVFEGMLAPILLFYLGYWTFGIWGALVASLAWSYGLIAARAFRGGEVSGLLILSALALTARTILALVTSSLFVYFLQPTLGTFIAGFAFLGSALIRRPLTERLSSDVVRLPDGVTTHPAVRDLHVRLSLLWAVVFVANGAVALWLLVSQSVVNFLIVKSILNTALVAGGIAISVLAFKRCVEAHAITVPHGQVVTVEVGGRG